MVTDIDFDRGNMILSLRDRNGDQTGYNNASDPNNPDDFNRKGITAGDMPTRHRRPATTTPQIPTASTRQTLRAHPPERSQSSA